MTRLLILIGTLLILLGVGGYVAGPLTGSDYASRTALIPAIPGALILVCGLVALAGPAARKHAIHAAMVVALLGVLASFMPLGRVVRGEAGPLAITSVLGMLLLCLTLLVLGVRSFVAARRERQAVPAA